MTDEPGHDRTLFADAPDGMAVVDPGTGQFHDVNERLCELYGYARSALLDRSVGTLAATDRSAPGDLLERLRDADDGERFTWRTEHADGTAIPVEVAVARTGDDGHLLVRVTERTDTRDRRAELDVKTRAMDEAPVGITITGPTEEDTPLIYVNDEFLDLTGYDRSEVLGRNCRFLQGEGTREEPVDRLREGIDAAEPVTVELRNYRKDGERFWNRVTVAPVRDDDGTVTNYVGFQQDVTERKRRERELDRYRRLFDRLPVGVFRAKDGGEGPFVDANAALVSMFGAESKSDLLGRSVDGLYLDSTEQAALAERLRETGEVVEQELQFRRLDGERFWGAVTAVLVEEDDEVYLDGVVHDITTRKQYRRRLEEQRDGLELLNEVVRHDIRNDLQLIIGHAERLESSLDGEDAEALSAVIESADNAVSLTRTARDLAETMLRTDAEPEPVALRPLLEDRIEDAASAHETASIAAEGDLPDVRVLADEMLGSVFRNLLNNAVQHNDTAHPTVRVSVTETDDRVRVRVADDGPGIPPDRRDDVFGKGEKGLDSDGTGIGLYLVNTLVEQYGGDVWIEDSEARSASGNRTQSGDADLGGAAVVVELQMASSGRQ
ncbi:MAG: PAS domain S-box protein [Halorientalis sp.]